MGDIVRVLRIVEYTGERAAVEAQIERSLRLGTHKYLPHVTIRIACVGDYPEILEGPEINTQSEKERIWGG